MEGSDPYRVEVVRWAALDVPSIMVEEDLTRMREQYRIPSDVELILPGPNERACFPREGCTALHLNAFVSGLRLPLHPMLRRILRAYSLAPTQVSPNGWSQMVGGMYLWFRHSFGMEMPLHVFQTVYQPRKLPKKKGKEEEVGWYYFCPWGVSQTLSDRLPLLHKTMEGELVLGIRQLAEGGRRPGAGLGCSKCLRNSQLSSSVRAFKREHRSSSVHLSGGYQEPELQLHLEPTALPAEMDQGRRPRPTLAKLAKQRPRTLVPGSAEDSSQRRRVRWSSRAPPNRPPAPEGESGGSYESKKRLRELIGAPGARIPDDALRSVPFFPSMGAQAFKKYFTPKWEEFSSHGELEDVLEASLALAIRASAMQMKVLGEFRNRMQEQKKRFAEASKADKEHQQALEGLKAALESAEIAYKQMGG
ncbi:Uncharacterized protein Adt_06247 [Abeliophyllum distichum]|uniref:Transposase (putative) gypsy type domain-containing protein n=1 Tax=Abeliophyllum distichum TaxID=126358 RepID=A0ABD1V6T1_9LAMI